MNKSIPLKKYPLLCECLLFLALFTTIIFFFITLPVWFLTVVIALQWTFSILVMVSGLYAHSLKSLSAVPVLMVVASFNRLALFCQLLMSMLLVSPKQAFSIMNLSVVQSFVQHNLLIACGKAVLLTGSTLLLLLWMLIALGRKYKNSSAHQAFQVAFGFMFIELFIGFLFSLGTGLLRFDSLPDHSVKLALTGLTVTHQALIFNGMSLPLWILLAMVAVLLALPILMQTIGIACVLSRSERQDSGSLAIVLEHQSSQYPQIFIISVIPLLILAMGIFQEWWTFGALALVVGSFGLSFLFKVEGSATAQINATSSEPDESIAGQKNQQSPPAS